MFVKLLFCTFPEWVLLKIKPYYKNSEVKIDQSSSTTANLYKSVLQNVF